MARTFVAERDSAPRDLLFAVASVAVLSGFDVPGTRLPVFLLFAFAIAMVSARQLWRSPFAKQALIPPLIGFLAVHLAFAFRVSVANGILFLLQAIAVGVFVLAFLNRYSQVSARRYLRLAGIGFVVVLAVVVVYHVAHHRYIGFKLLSDPKAVFDLLPVMLVVLRQSNSRAAKISFAILLPIFVLCILLSGERKAYLLLALVAPMLLNLRSIVTYLMPIALAAVVAGALSLDSGGYVARQLSTVSRLARGDTGDTVSDEARSWAIDHAKDLFLANPAIGVGTNGYGADIAPDMLYNHQPHNEWLRVAAENGIVGLSLYIATVAWGCIGLARRRVGARERTSSERRVALALFLTFVIFLSFEALDFTVIMAFLFTPILQYLRLDPDDTAPPALRSRGGYR